MEYYSLVASLPTIKIGNEPSFSCQAFVDQCTQWVTGQEAQILRQFLLNGQSDSHFNNPICKKWLDIETQLRNAMVRFRAQKLGIDFREYLRPHDGFSGQIEQLVMDAFTCSDPFELEQEIDRARWQLAEGLIGQNPFGFNKLLVYGIQLKIVERWCQMDKETGKDNLESVITENTEKK